MKIDVAFVGPMKRPWPERSRTVEVSEGTVLAELLRSFGYTDEEAKFLTCSVNGTAVRLRAPLHEGDQLSITLMLGGG